MCFFITCNKATLINKHKPTCPSPKSTFTLLLLSANQKSISQAVRQRSPLTLGLTNVLAHLLHTLSLNGEAFTVHPIDCRALACDVTAVSVRNLRWERDPPEPWHPKYRFLRDQPNKHTQLGTGALTAGLSFEADPR